MISNFIINNDNYDQKYFENEMRVRKTLEFIF